MMPKMLLAHKSLACPFLQYISQLQDMNFDGVCVCARNNHASY